MTKQEWVASVGNQSWATVLTLLAIVSIAGMAAFAYLHRGVGFWVATLIGASTFGIGMRLWFDLGYFKGQNVEKEDYEARLPL